MTTQYLFEFVLLLVIRQQKMKGIFLFILIVSGLFGQELPLIPNNWDVQTPRHVFENYLGKPSLYLHQGEAVLKDVNFFTGTFEFKIYGTGRRGFPGVHFRVQDSINHEEFYVRFHQSGNPDANQYTPVFNGLTGWQMYYGERFSSPVTYKVNDWNHITNYIMLKSRNGQFASGGFFMALE